MVKVTVCEVCGGALCRHKEKDWHAKTGTYHCGWNIVTEEGIIEQMLKNLPDQTTQALQAKKEEFQFYSKSDGKSVKVLTEQWYSLIYTTSHSFEWFVGLVMTIGELRWILNLAWCVDGCAIYRTGEDQEKIIQEEYGESN